VTCAVIFAASFVALILWEWFAENPVMDLKLLKNRNFAVCCFLMLLTGGFLNATTVLQPQFMQSSLGYTATIAGLALSGGGLVLLLIVPIAGQLVTHFPARNVIAAGFVGFSFAYFITARRLNLGLSFGESSWLRILQVYSIPLVFISVTTAAYFGMPREKNNQVAGLINFVRNIGGSILISLTNAAVVERAQFHQNQLLKYLIPVNANLQQQVNSLTSYFDPRTGPANAGNLAQGRVYNQLIQHATVLAYVDVFYILCGVAILMIPLSFLLQKNHPHGKGKGEPIAAH
jgi:MFS transporter, DHA2 family, multidrug resistance protein